MRRIYDTPTRTFILSMARKNAKTAFVCFLVLLHLAGPECRQNSQLVSAARSRDQAAIVFSYAAKSIRLSPLLAPFITIRDTRKELFYESKGSTYRAMSADAATAYGANPAFAAHDELGQVVGPRDDLYDAIESAMGAQDEPISVVISTQAPSSNDLLSILIDDAKSGADPTIKVELYTAPKGIDPFSLKAIRLANPHFGDFMNQGEVLKQANKAKRLPTQEAKWRNLNLNQRVALNNPYMPESIWDACAGPINDAIFFDGRPVYAGLDLSARGDLTALALMAQDDEGIWHGKLYYFTPEQGLEERSKHDRAPYDLWAAKGFIIPTPGTVVDYGYVIRYIRDEIVGLGANIVSIAYDRWRIDVLKAAAANEEVELPLEEFGQGFRDMTPALEGFEAICKDGKFRHGNNPVLRSNMANAIATNDPAGNRKLDKTKASGRIDGAVAIVMAGARAQLTGVVERSFWESAA